MYDEVRTHLDAHGYAIVPRVLESAQVEALRSLAEPLLDVSNQAKPGVRRVLQRVPRIADVLAMSRVRELIASVGGTGAGVVRAILFDKSPTANWSVPWHQDAAIAVKERHEVDGYGPWSMKDGEHHCQPPRHVIDRVFVVRLHLDECLSENGPLRVIPESHLEGLRSAAALEEQVRTGPIVDCSARLGDAVLMRPLTIHSSARAAKPADRRRVLHLECCDVDLAEPLEWAERVLLRTKA